MNRASSTFYRFDYREDEELAMERLRWIAEDYEITETVDCIMRCS